MLTSTPSPTIPDPGLILRAQHGDKHAITLLYEHYHVKIFRYLYYRTGDTHTAEDLTSEVFLRMLKALSHYQPGSAPFQSWLYMIARNIAIDYHRSTMNKPQISLNESVPHHQPSLEALTDFSLTVERLRKALSRLDAEQKDVLILRFILAEPIAQVAQTLHKSIDAVKGLQYRALNSLRNQISDLEE
jgi:RNA polymerase sigma-70 factor (ECF subfamily)